MNRISATPYLSLIFYFSFVLTEVSGLITSPVFAKSNTPAELTVELVLEQSLASPETKTVAKIPDMKMRGVSLFGKTERPGTQAKPVLERMYAGFWGDLFKNDDDSEETSEPKPEPVEPEEQKTPSEVPENKIMDKGKVDSEELPWWKPDAYEIIEEETTPEEVVPENKIRVVPPAMFKEKPATEEKPEMKMQEVVPEIPPAVKPEAVEIPEPTFVPEVVPEKKLMGSPLSVPLEKPVMEEKPAMKMQEVVPEIPPAVKPEAVEIPEPTIVPEVVPEKKMMDVPPALSIEKPVMEEKPEMKMQEVVPEIPPVVKPEAVEIPEPTIVPEVVPEKKMMDVPPVVPIEKPVVEKKPAMKMQEIVPETKVTSPGFFKGAKVCEECHEGEFKIWKKTKHHTSFRTVHREPKDSAKPSPKKILKNVAGAKRMKRNKTCYLCHYTLEQKDAGAKPVAKSGTSCESCHGASSEYLAIHDNYGGEGIKREDETQQHKKERIEKSAATGLIWPIHKYQVVENCMTCHGLAHPDLSGDVLAKMLGAGHPINPDFETVKYSQGTVRHRYTPEDINNNREMTEAEKAELFVIGHAAALVSAREAMSKSNEPKYTKAQNKRAANAEAVLSLLSDIPEAAQLMASPNRSNALKLVNALAGKDLTGKVGSMLPKKSDYK